ncbi:MAG: 5,6-dimethylbenzimidazole synthase [Azospirillum sp.]|nr:5,6-dimethylbenzimidazole synthase [Azospirillum sp.]
MTDQSLPRAAPVFDSGFRGQLDDLLRWRRDVRHFRTEALPPTLLDTLLDRACLSPSVGNCQPWRFVRVDDPARRAAVRADFEECNAEALAGQAEERRTLYARLKLAGLREAPVQLAVFADEDTSQGHGLGRLTMPEMLRYSAVLAVHTLWLAARAQGVGVGWVSILSPPQIASILEVPGSWALIAYLCLGWPVEETPIPELERAGWQPRTDRCRQVLQR